MKLAMILTQAADAQANKVEDGCSRSGHLPVKKKAEGTWCN